MKVELNRWLGYEGWLDKKLAFEIDENEISLDKPCRGGRMVLAHILGPDAMLGMTSKDIQTLCSLLSEKRAKTNKKNKGEIKQ